MKKQSKACSMAALALAAAVVLPGFSGITAKAASAPTNTPYNINFSLGTNASQMRFNWFSTAQNSPEVEISKTSDMQGGNFPSGASVIYGSSSAATATVSVEDHPGNPNAPTTDSVTGNNEYANKVTVDGLAPSTKYTYRVGDGSAWSSNYTFSTGDPGNSFSFAAFGDPQIGAGSSVANDQAGWADTLKKVTTKYPSLNFLFTLGDEVNNYDAIANQQAEYKAFFNPSATDKPFQTFPLVAFEGNHDHQMGTYYSYHYNQPNLSALGQTQNSNVDNKDGDYWFTYGDVLFMVLNGNDPYDTAAHDLFMQQAVSANPNVKWKVAAWHQSAYSEANHANSNSSDDPILFIRQNWPKLMDKYGVDVVLQGHDHEYTRTYQMYGGIPVSTTKTNSVENPKGTVYFTLDSGSGSKYYNFNTASDHSFSEVFWQQYAPTYSYITMSDNKFSINTFRTDTGDSIDNYTITKSIASQPTKPSAPAAANTNSGSSNKTSGNPKTSDSHSDAPLAAIMISGTVLLLAAAGALLLAKKRKADAR